MSGTIVRCSTALSFDMGFIHINSKKCVHFDLFKGDFCQVTALYLLNISAAKHIILAYLYVLKFPLTHTVIDHKISKYDVGSKGPP